MTTHWTKEKKTTLRQVREVRTQSLQKPHACCSSPELGENSKPGASLQGLKGSDSYWAVQLLGLHLETSLQTYLLENQQGFAT